MLEIEQKFAHADFAALEKRLADLGAAAGPDQIEEDHYHNAPDRDFAQTGEAFRLRRIGPNNLLTFKGPRSHGPVKVRAEFEVALPEGDQAADDFLTLLRLLGYRPTAIVRKRRRNFHLRRDAFAASVTLDDVHGLGRFVEVEVIAATGDRAAAEAAVAALAADLGLSALEQRSYLQLVLEKGS
jgi:adenylate cyclase class 2